jgi:arylsulfatase A-like enzyme
MSFLHEQGLAAEHVADFRRREPYRSTWPTPLPEYAYCDNWIADQALDVLRRRPVGAPWHLVVNFAGPHDPMDVTADMQARWRDVAFTPPIANRDPGDPVHQSIRQNYAAMIENIDDQIGRLLDEVDSRGEAANTLVIYSSDHGEMLGDHDLWNKSTYYHPSVWIPLTVAGPGCEPGQVSDALVSGHDITATILDFARIPLPPDMDSQSFAPVIRGERRLHRDAVVSGLVQSEQQLKILRHYTQEAPEDPLSGDWRMIYDGRFKLVVGPDGMERMFDLHLDPDETAEIVAGETAKRESLRQRLSELTARDPRGWPVASDAPPGQ